jgi:hypothetical protein
MYPVICSGSKGLDAGGAAEYSSITGTDGRYSIRLSGIYDKIGGLVEAGCLSRILFQVQLLSPFIIKFQGMSVFRFSIFRAKSLETIFRQVYPGSYSWYGMDATRMELPEDGFYFYVIEFKASRCQENHKGPGFHISRMEPRWNLL